MPHRGPDDEGITLIDPERDVHQDIFTESSARRLQRPDGRGGAPDIPHRIGIAHRRFSLVDTSAAGHQPFWCPEAKLCVAFNGEIYNYVELRDELEQKGFKFRTASDTEVLLIGVPGVGSGVLSALQRFLGPQPV
jgi:asparagine synthase (glutamine-hydrolysing)